MPAKTITQRDVDRLDTVAWGEAHFGSLCTNRQFPRRAMERLEARGLVECIGLVEQADGDGGTLAGRRERPGYVLTAKGRAMLTESEVPS